MKKSKMPILLKIHPGSRKAANLVLKFDHEKHQIIKEQNLGKLECLPVEIDGQEASNEIKRLVSTDLPVMVARFGSNELKMVLKYKQIKETALIRKVKNFIRADKDWWWDELQCQEFCNNSGFFPYSSKNMERFSKINDFKYEKC